MALLSGIQRLLDAFAEGGLVLGRLLLPTQGAQASTQH